jgi:two-component system response regulator HydG
VTALRARTAGPALQPARLLVVEDNAALRAGIVRALRESFAQVDEEDRGERAVERLRARGVEAYDVVVTDLRLPGADGFAVLEAAQAADPRTAVLLMTAHGSIESAVDAMRRGAVDFLTKPFELAALELRVQKALQHARLVGEVTELRRERRARLGAERIVGASPALRAAVDLARRVAASRATVLVTGETGTGKELVAGLIHAHSPRAAAPFVKVNCAALPETLLESELFGHERGAFTGADRAREGRFEQADGGTLFLDEVGEMSAGTQAKLLRVLQDGEFHRLGAVGPVRSDVRVVAATNLELEKAVAGGRFRADLYFRLDVIRIHLPPLRERPEDAEALARHFLAEFARELGRAPRSFSARAWARIRAHAWPGNVRELRNTVERAVLLSDGDPIGEEHLALSDAPSAAGEAGAWRPGLPAGGLGLEDVERAVVTEALERTRYVQKDAARLLRVSRRKLNYMIRRMGITHASWRRNREVPEDVEEGPPAGVDLPGIG